MPQHVQRVLIPLDAGERAGPLLDVVQRFDLPEGAEVRLLHVVPEGSSRARIRAAWEHLARKASGTRGPKPGHTVLVGDPARQIVECAVAGEASLIVLRSRAAGGPPAWTRGSVAERVVQKSPVPVLLLSSARDREVGALRRILVPVQGPSWDPGRAPDRRSASSASDHRRSALAVLRLVAALARRQEAVVQLLAVVEPSRGGVGLVARRARAEAYLEELHGSLGGVAALRRVVTGSPDVEVTRSLADEDLLAVPVRRDHPGPIGDALLRRCPCALLTVPVE